LADMPCKVIEEPAFRERAFIFQDRFHAGTLLAKKLQKYAAQPAVILLAVPAGGVPVGCVVATELGVEMEVVVVRKIQIPWNTEAGFGALTWDGETVLNEYLISGLGLAEKMIRESISKTERTVAERLRRFRGDRPMPDFNGKIVILVDDGLASGYTMLAAVRSVRKRGPEKVVVAVPTGSLRAVEFLSSEADEIVCLNIRSGPIFAVADAYRNWFDLSDDEVMDILGKLRTSRCPSSLDRS